MAPPTDETRRLAQLAEELPAVLAELQRIVSEISERTAKATRERAPLGSKSSVEDASATHRERCRSLGKPRRAHTTALPRRWSSGAVWTGATPIASRRWWTRSFTC